MPLTVGKLRPVSGARCMRWLFVAVLWASAATAQAGLFDDDEARKAILDLRARIQASDDAAKARHAELAASTAAALRAAVAALNGQNTQVAEQVVEQLAQLRRSLLDLNAQLETNRAELARMRGAQEQLSRDVAELQRRQKDGVQSLEDRVRKLEPQTVAFEGSEFIVEPDEKRSHDEAMASMRAADFNKGAVQLAAFLRRYPGSGYAASARFWLGNALYGKKDYKEAINVFRAFATDLPDHPRAPEALLSVANCQFEMKDAKTARRTLDEVQKTYPKSEAAAAAKERLASTKG